MKVHLHHCGIACCCLFLRIALSQAPAADPAHAKHPPLPKPSNLQVLPKDITNQSLIPVMIGFAQGLGVGCPYCHEAKPGVDPEYDLNFASDAKPQKQTARVMLRMVSDINGTYLTEIATAHQGPAVVCGNCHLGHAIPPAFKPSGPPPE